MQDIFAGRGQKRGDLFPRRRGHGHFNAARAQAVKRRIGIRALRFCKQQYAAESAVDKGIQRLSSAKVGAANQLGHGGVLR